MFLGLMEAVKLGLVFLTIIIALRRKVPMGLTLLGMGPVTALIYQVPIDLLLSGYGEVIGSQRFISLTGLVVLVTIMGSLLKDLGFLDRLGNACKGIYGGSRTAVTILPPLIGIMPMPGGSLLSAPLVNSVLDDPRYPPHFKCVTNYWFRHLIELTWPVYPGIVLTEAVTGMPIATVSMLQAPLMLAMIIVGLFMFARHVKTDPIEHPALWKPLLGISKSIWPLVIAILMYGVFEVELSLSFLFALLVLVTVTRPSKKIMIDSLKAGLSVKLLAFIFGVLTFQMVLEISGGIESIPKLASVYHLPEELVISIVCFSIGLLTGMISAYVGLGYTLLAGLLYQPVINPGYILLASMAGFTGFLLSPAHLCMVLTTNYFGADLTKVIKTLVLPLLLVTIIGWAVYLSGYGSLFE
jgi:hypothetical protein